MLEVESLDISWDGEPICEDVSFSIGEGKVSCLLGKSGVGKSTIFHVLAGLSLPDDGSITLDGISIEGQPGSVSYMLQKDLLFDHCTILDNVAMPMRIKGKGKGEARAIASPYFPKFGIEGTQDCYPFQLSGGMRQRAALLRTYLMGSKVMLLDEPFSALDSMTRKEMQHWLLDMVTQLSLSAMLITHDIDEAIYLSDEILVLAPANGISLPSTIVKRFNIDASRKDREEFALGQDAMDIKRQVLEILEPSLL